MTTTNPADIEHHLGAPPASFEEAAAKEIDYICYRLTADCAHNPGLGDQMSSELTAKVTELYRQWHPYTSSEHQNTIDNPDRPATTPPAPNGG